MIRQIVFVFADIKRNIPQFVISFLQISISIILLCYIIKIGIDFNLGMEKLHQLTKNSNIYMLYEDSESEQFSAIINDKAANARQLQLYKYIQNLDDMQSYTASRWSKFYIDGNPKKLPDKIISRYVNSKIGLDQVCVSSNFFHIFNLKGQFDLADIESSFGQIEKSKNKPAILGASYEKYYKLGETIHASDGKSYIVKGFLNKGEYYVAPQEVGGFVTLDNYVIVPEEVNEDDSMTVIEHIVTTNFITDDETIMQGIINKCNSLDLYPMHYSNFRAQMKSIVAQKQDQLLTMGAVMAIVFIFASIGLIGYLVQYISDSAREFAIHILCGAEEKEILYRIFLQVILLLLMAMSVTVVVFGLNKAVLFTFVISIGYLAIILIYPTVLLKRTSIIEIIRSNSK